MRTQRKVIVQFFDATMVTLPPLNCPGCGGRLEAAILSSKPPVARHFAHCARKCVRCEIGASNAHKQGTETWICREPLKGIPVEIREGAMETLRSAFNERNRRNKETRFGFSTSEDAITWVVFAYLVRSRGLTPALERLGLITSEPRVGTPTVLLWGVPINNYARGEVLKAELRDACRSFTENESSFSEPDVVVDFEGEGVLFIEAKYLASNDKKPADYSGWERYAEADLTWNYEAVRNSGYYELARNWCLLNRLAGARPKTLINLAPSTLFTAAEQTRLGRFFDAIRAAPNAKFTRLTWRNLLDGVVDRPKWLNEFCSSRKGLLG